MPMSQSNPRHRIDKQQHEPLTVSRKNEAKKKFIALKSFIDTIWGIREPIQKWLMVMNLLALLPNELALLPICHGANNSLLAIPEAEIPAK